ncbi:hypothetical protein QZH41_005554 [Actinostola sp. cb2023]|nr:hypothetical protein QZH41_005554 [Actinostola sp. cb2023]
MSPRYAYAESKAIYRFNNTLNIDERWQTTLVNIIDVHVPKAKARNSDTPPWIDAEIIHLLYKRKETARQASKRSNSPALRNKYKELRKWSTTPSHCLLMTLSAAKSSATLMIVPRYKMTWTAFRAGVRTGDYALLNTTKCEILTVTRKRNPVEYHYKIGLKSTTSSALDSGVDMLYFD